MLDWVKVYWHCLSKFHRNFKGEYHQMCESSAWEQKTEGSKKKLVEGSKQHFCSCGYNNEGTTWEKLKKDLQTIKENGE